eukprot:RCo046740
MQHGKAELALLEVRAVASLLLGKLVGDQVQVVIADLKKPPHVVGNAQEDGIQPFRHGRGEVQQHSGDHTECPTCLAVDHTHVLLLRRRKLRVAPVHLHRIRQMHPGALLQGHRDATQVNVHAEHNVEQRGVCAVQGLRHTKHDVCRGLPTALSGVVAYVIDDQGDVVQALSNLHNVINVLLLHLQDSVHSQNIPDAVHRASRARAACVQQGGVHGIFDVDVALREAWGLGGELGHQLEVDVAPFPDPLTELLLAEVFRGDGLGRDHPAGRPPRRGSSTRRRHPNPRQGPRKTKHRNIPQQKK